MNNVTDVTDHEEKAARLGYCPKIFDNFLHWPETAPGTIANQSCPNMAGFDFRNQAYKKCLENGTWFRHPVSGRIWTNYTTCLDLEDVSFTEHINTLTVVGYWISFTAIVVSIAIFLSFRTLICTRSRIHINLFLSIALQSLMYILLHYTIAYTVHSESWLHLFHIVLKYFMLTNLMWMLCEALHLYYDLIVVFANVKEKMKWFLALGWGTPLIIIILYDIVRVYNPLGTAAFWILEVPLMTSLYGSLVLLIKMRRIILKMNSPNPVIKGIGQTARAALVLVPVFGLPHILPFIYYPGRYEPYEHLYRYVTVATTTLQGLYVSWVLCFTNHDVHQAVRNFIHRQIHLTFSWFKHHIGSVKATEMQVIEGNL